MISIINKQFCPELACIDVHCSCL